MKNTFWEEFLKTGFSKSTSVKLINSSLLYNFQQDNSSTIDLGILDLKNGELEKETMVKNSKKTVADQIELMTEKLSVNEYDYTLINFDGNVSTLNWISDYAESKGLYLNKGILPINVCAHCGPGTIGLSISKKINEKSLKDFIN